MLVSLPERASQDLQFVRNAIARVDGASAASGVGGMLMGVCGVCVAILASAETDFLAQLRIWLAGGMLAAPLGLAAVLFKARRRKLHWDPVRRFVLCLLPCLFVGALLSWQLRLAAQFALIPAVWLLLYGCGVLAAGSYAVQPVRWMGVAFIGCGVAACWVPVAWLNALLGSAFGILHIVFGWWVFKRHGG